MTQVYNKNLIRENTKKENVPTEVNVQCTLKIKVKAMN